MARRADLKRPGFITNGLFGGFVQGSLEFGKDADIVVWDPEESFVIDSTYPIYFKNRVKYFAYQHRNYFLTLATHNLNT